MTLFEVFLGMGCALLPLFFLFYSELHSTTLVAESYEALTGGFALVLGTVQVSIAPVAEFVGWGLLLLGLAFWSPLFKNAFLTYYVPAWTRLCSRITNDPRWDVWLPALAGVGCLVLGIFLEKLAPVAHTLGAMLLLFSLSDWKCVQEKWKRLPLRLRSVLKGIRDGGGWF